MRCEDETVFNCQRNSLSVAVIRIILFNCAADLALLTVLTHLCQLIGISFQTYSIFFLVAAGFTQIIVIWYSTKIVSNITQWDFSVLTCTLILGAVGSIAACSIFRPDADDYYYFTNVIYYLDHPNKSMGFDIHFLASNTEPFESVFLNTSMPFDYGRGLVSFFLNIDPLYSYYITADILTGALIPFTYFYLLSFFFKNTYNVFFATLFTILLLMVCGDTHRTFGNFAFSRAFQGKSLCMIVGLPLFCGTVIEYFGEKKSDTLIFAGTTATAMLGVSSTAVILIPNMFLLILGSLFIISEKRITILKHSLYIFGSLIYLFGYGLCVMGDIPFDLRRIIVSYYPFPSTFLGHVMLFINPKAPFTPIVIFLSATFFMVVSSSRQKLFIANWFLILVVFILNPISYYFIVNYFITSTIYWRLFYLLPFPLIAGLAFGNMLDYQPHTNVKRSIILVMTMCVFIIGMICLPGSVVNKQMNWGQYKIKLPENKLNISRKIVKSVNHGNMLAPYPISGIVPMLSSDFPQICVRGSGLKIWSLKNGHPGEAERRVNAWKFVNGKGGKLNDFIYIIEKYCVQTLVIRKHVLKNNDVQSLIIKEGFIISLIIDEYAVFTRKNL